MPLLKRTSASWRQVCVWLRFVFCFLFLEMLYFYHMASWCLVMGLMENSPGQGCILADDMGLGKTIQVRRELGADFIDTAHSLFWVFLLQSIVLIWTLLKQGQKGPCPQNDPIAKRVIVITPTRLHAIGKKFIFCLNPVKQTFLSQLHQMCCTIAFQSCEKLAEGAR